MLHLCTLCQKNTSNMVGSTWLCLDCRNTDEGAAIVLADNPMATVRARQACGHDTACYAKNYEFAKTVNCWACGGAKELGIFARNMLTDY